MPVTAVDNNYIDGSGLNQITLGGRRFRQSVDGEYVNVSDGPLNVIIVNAAKLARTYY